MAKQVKVGNVLIGGGRAVIIAGPCSVEPGYLTVAEQTADAGADILRAFVYKHRTSPHSFQGMGSEGIKLVREAKRRTGLPVVIEPLSTKHVEELSDVADAFQIGSRGMQNVELLRAVGELGIPVILKRGLASTYDEWLSAAQYIEVGGNSQIILCERGIRTFETGTRNTLDLAAVPYLRTVCDYPIIVDPSHAAGQRDLVPALAEAGLAIGADGIEVEAHTSPDDALSDAAQTITMEDLAIICSRRDWYWAQSSDRPHSLEESRYLIDAIDSALIKLVESRISVSRSLKTIKEVAGLSIHQPEREGEVISAWLERGRFENSVHARKVAESIVRMCREVQQPEAVRQATYNSSPMEPIARGNVLES